MRAPDLIQKAAVLAGRSTRLIAVVHDAEAVLIHWRVPLLILHALTGIWLYGEREASALPMALLMFILFAVGDRFQRVRWFWSLLSVGIIALPVALLLHMPSELENFRILKYRYDWVDPCLRTLFWLHLATVSLIVFLHLLKCHSANARRHVCYFLLLLAVGMTPLAFAPGTELRDIAILSVWLSVGIFLYHIAMSRRFGIYEEIHPTKTLVQATALLLINASIWLLVAGQAWFFDLGNHLERNRPGLALWIAAHRPALVNALDSSGEPPLCEAKDPETALRLIELGADVNGRTADDSTPLLECLRYPKVVKRLLEHGAWYDQTGRWPSPTPIHKAAEHGYHDSLKVLIAFGADPSAADRKGNTPLHDVHDAEIVKILIEAGADANAQNSIGDVPLDTNNSFEVRQALLSYGAKKPEREEEDLQDFQNFLGQ